MVNNKHFLNKSLRLVTLLMAIVALSCVTCATHLYAHNIDPTILLPDIGWDSAGDAPPPGPINGITTYTPGSGPTAGSGHLSMTAKVVSFIPATIAAPLLIGGTFAVNAALTSVTPGGALVHAHFGTMVGSGFTNPNTYDVEIKDTAGALALGGNFGDFTINGIYGDGAVGGGLFTPMAGYLLPDFLSFPSAGMVHQQFATGPGWSATSFSAPWTSESKGDLGPVPEPGTIALLGTGLLGMLGYTSRRRFRKKS